MDNLNGPVILTKQVDLDTVTFHRRQGQEAVYVDYHFCIANQRRFNLIGVSFLLTPDEIRILTRPSASP